MSKNSKTSVQRYLSWVEWSTRLCDQLNSTHHKNSCTQLKNLSSHWNQGTFWDSSSRGTWNAYSGTSGRWWCRSSNSKPRVGLICCVFDNFPSSDKCQTRCAYIAKDSSVYQNVVGKKVQKRVVSSRERCRFRKGVSKIVKFPLLD